MLLTQQPTFDQMPAFLVGIAGELQTIKERLTTGSPNNEVEKPIGVSGAAEHADLDEQTIYRLVRLKRIPHHKQGRKLYFYASELNDWIKSGQGKTLEDLKQEAERDLLAANKRR